MPKARFTQSSSMALLASVLLRYDYILLKIFCSFRPVSVENVGHFKSNGLVESDDLFLRMGNPFLGVVLPIGKAVSYRELRVPIGLPVLYSRTGMVIE